MNTPDITVQKEDLDILVMPRDSIVTAKYILKNNGAAREISYYFPISHYVEDDYISGGSLQWIKFYDGAKQLYYTKTSKKQSNLNPDGSQKESDKPGGMEIGYEYVVNTFYNTKLSFAAGETKTLTVSFRASNSFSSGESSKQLLSTYSDVIFLYDLRPAAAWGNGKAGVFNLNVDYSAIRDVPQNALSINIPSFKRDSSLKFKYSQNNYDYKKQGFITMKFNYPFVADELKQFAVKPDILNDVYVSSTLNNDFKKYGITNLFDGNLKTMWATNQNKGIGTQFLLSFDRAASSGGDTGYDGFAIGILNGDIENEYLYYANERIKKLNVEIFDNDGTFDDGYAMDFPDLPYKEINKNNIFAYINTIDLTDCGSRNLLVRLTVLEVYPGSEYNDLCIGKIYCFGALYGDKKLEIEKGFHVSNDASEIIKLYKQKNGVSSFASTAIYNTISSDVSTNSNQSIETKVSDSSFKTLMAKSPLKAAWIIILIALLLFLCVGGGVIYIKSK